MTESEKLCHKDEGTSSSNFMCATAANQLAIGYSFWQKKVFHKQIERVHSLKLAEGQSGVASIAWKYSTVARKSGLDLYEDIEDDEGDHQLFRSGVAGHKVPPLVDARSRDILRLSVVMVAECRTYTTDSFWGYAVKKKVFFFPLLDKSPLITVPATAQRSHFCVH
ncbi:hypothetical protein OUZ56_007800 [Daphnia magna]|uniref:Uncharacterized protein n=1 Tax=Daphnia magna TaxID=35525 RepID=A0ABR0ABD2_9CRUS|nr:hypothetical protein OUZ56_007800 [Daphnia magna]